MCQHEPRVGAICEHLASAAEYCEWYGGHGLEHDLVCPGCAEAGRRGTTPVCAACQAAARIGLAWNADRGVIGRPGVRERDAGLALVHERVELDGRLPAPIVDLRPAPGAAARFLALLADGALWWIDLERRALDRCADLAGHGLHAGRPAALLISPDGGAAAVVSEERGRGVVLALDDGRETVALARSDFRAGEAFPVALGVLGGRPLVVHATRWNRLDVVDALTGDLLTARSHGQAAPGERLPHYLDHRHQALAISPDGEYVATAGESEHGLASVTTFSLRRLLEDDPWESEDGPSRWVHAPRWYAGGAPMAWLDGRRLAIWGYGPSAACLVDGVSIHDAIDGTLVRWFAGVARGELAVAGDRLFGWTADGTQLWDLARGERLLEDRGLVPQRYHAGAGCFVTTNREGDLFVRSVVAARTSQLG
jgi:hypothetical protein